MRIEYIFRPIEKFPRAFTPHSARRRSPFKAGWQDTMDKLERELSLLGARQCVLQLALVEGDLRLDGRPRLDARPSHPGVVVTFTGKHGAMLMPCDEFFDWQSNVRAVALTLERLRMADLYGVTRHGEQYTGWKKLPPVATAAAGMSAEAAALILADLSGLAADKILTNTENFEAAFREAAKRHHPDKSTGNHEKYLTLTTAAEVLKKMHKDRAA